VEANKVTREKLLSWIKYYYYGYSWDGENFLYNPISILNLFYAREFGNYWANTGSPKLIVDMIKASKVDLKDLAKKESIFKGRFPYLDIEHIDLHTLLLQTGYLTIKNGK